MQGCELRGQPVGHTARVAGAAPRRNRVLIPVAEPRIEERARAVHLGRANVRVPVGDRAEPSPRVQVDAREAEGRWEKRSGLLPIRPERLPVLVKLCVEAARPPAREHCFDRREIDAQEIGEGFEVRRERHDGADAAMLLASDGFVELQRVAPERFIAERVESEGLAPFPHHAVGVVLDHLVEARGHPRAHRVARWVDGPDGTHEPNGHEHYPDRQPGAAWDNDSHGDPPLGRHGAGLLQLFLSQAVLCDRVTRRTADGKGGRKSQHYSKHGAGRTRSATAYSMQKCSPGGRSLHASASRASPSTCTNRERTGRVAGPRMTAPEVTSNWLPWQWHVTVVPSNLPIASEHPAWVQVSSKAYRCPSAFATSTWVPAILKTRICPAVTSFELPIRTSMALPSISSCARKRGPHRSP